MPAAAGLALPSSAARQAALERLNTKEICLLLRLEEKDVSLRRLSRTRFWATDSAAKKESARTTPATGSTV